MPSDTKAHLGEDPGPSPRESLQWRHWPLVDLYPRSLWFVVVFVGVCVAAGVAFGHVGYGLLSAAVLGLALARYLLPTTYVLDGRGATVRSLGQSRTLEWSRVRRVASDERGVFLSPYATPSRMDSFRGHYLWCGGNVDEVVSFVTRKTQLADQVCPRLAERV